MFDYDTVIIATTVFAFFFVFCTPKCVFDRIFPDTMYAINTFWIMVEDHKMNVVLEFYDQKTLKLLTAWNFLRVTNPFISSDNYQFEVTEKGKKFVDKYKNNKYGIRIFVIGKLLERFPKFILPFIGANILFVWYKYFENYLEKLFDMCK